MVEYLKFWMAQHLASFLMGVAVIFGIAVFVFAVGIFNEVRKAVRMMRAKR